MTHSLLVRVLLLFNNYIKPNFVSPVDAHVGRALFSDAILGALRGCGKTVILVTHALHFLSQCDYIYTISSGRIEEQGTYQTLVHNNGEFARLIKEFGGNIQREEEVEEEEEAMGFTGTRPTAKIGEAKFKTISIQRAGAGTGKLEGRLIAAEKRTTGSMSWGSECFNFDMLITLTVHIC